MKADDSEANTVKIYLASKEHLFQNDFKNDFKLIS